MDIQKTGKFIKEQRDKLGLSQNELSSMVHVTRQAVSNWENGKTLPDSDVLLSLSALFHVTINDILCGESMEATVLELVDDNNKKANKYRKVIKIFSLIISFFVVFILAFYFIMNYNSIKVYRVASQSNHFKIVDGIIVSTSTNTYFKLGKIEVKKGDDITVNRVKLYYKKGTKKEIIFENHVEDRLYVDRTGYKEMYRKTFNEYKNDLYLEITYNNQEKETLHLKAKKDFSNGFTMLFDESGVLKKTPAKEIQERLELTLKEESKQFEKSYSVRNDLKPIVNDMLQLETPSSKEQVLNISEEQSKEEQLIEEKESEIVLEPTEEQNELEEPEEIPEQEEMPEINFEEIINIIETYGTSLGRIKQLEYKYDQKSITVCCNKKSLMIDILNDSILETVTIKNKNGLYIIYQNNTIEETIEESIEEFYKNNPETYNRIYDYLMLVYQEIN